VGFKSADPKVYKQRVKNPKTINHTSDKDLLANVDVDTENSRRIMLV
jgi:hypothetical protein